MSDGKKLVASILETGSVQTLRQAGDDLFEDSELPVFQFVKRHFRRYGELPNVRTVEQETRQRLPAAPESVEYYLKRLYDRKLFVALREDFGSLRDALQNFNVEQAREIIDRMKSSCRVSTPDEDVRNAQEAGRAVLEAYEAANLNPGLSGITTGWGGLDEITGGYQNGDLVAWIARMGLGKTYVLLKQADAAWLAGYNVLFVTMEMTIPQIARRWLGIHADVNPDLIRKGMLDFYQRRRLRSYVHNLRGVERFHIFAGAFAKKVSDLEVLMHELTPDIVYIDSAYRMQPDSTNNKSSRFDKVAGAFDDLKKLTITTDRPIITTSQFSRQAGKRGREGSLETISFTDAIGMHASLIFALKEGSPPYESTRREFEIMKGREGEGGSFQINFKFKPIDFSEIPRDPAQAQVQRANMDWMA